MSVKAKLVISACLSVFGLISSSALANEYAYDGEECFDSGTYHQAYVPCISAVEGFSQGWTGNNNNNNSCFAYNRDGRTCSFVGYSEGQSGTPWGQGAGQFRCTNGCLQYVGQ
ncbi:MAG: hypothetical protein FJ146_18130 [Deltaproteobacteria bacterium]|nr:hypothetical protein [Deltaproteobacteria bacterium]